MTRFLVTAFLVVSGVASAQGVDPVLRFPVLDHVADQVFVGGAYYDTTVACPRWYNGTAYTACAVDAAGMSSAISTATSGLATTSALNSAISGEVTARNAAISTATTGLASTAALNAAIAGEVTARNSAISTATAGLATTSSVNSAISTAVAPLATVASVTAEASTRASADTTINAAIAALQANTQLTCVSATLTGLSIPLTGGLSSVVNVTVPNAPVGTACFVGGANRIPAGARPDVVVSTAGTASVAFVGGGGLLSGVIAIANGTYRICCAL